MDDSGSSIFLFGWLLRLEARVLISYDDDNPMDAPTCIKQYGSQSKNNEADMIPGRHINMSREQKMIRVRREGANEEERVNKKLMMRIQKMFLSAI